jgi:hypothetical protein
MSSQGNQNQSNKKQRRKNARANLQPTRLLDNEHDEINQTQEIISTQNNHEQVNNESLVTNAVQGLALNINEETDNV